MLYQVCLNANKYKTTIITNGIDGINGLGEALTNVYDLIILDVILPGINGFDILKELKNNKRYNYY